MCQLTSNHQAHSLVEWQALIKVTSGSVYASTYVIIKGSLAHQAVYASTCAIIKMSLSSSLSAPVQLMEDCEMLILNLG